LCWLGDQINHNAIHREEVKSGQAGSWWDLLFQELFSFFFNCPLDHIPGVVAMMGMPLHYFLMIMVGWLLMRPPILHLPNHKIISEICKYFLFLFSFFIALSYLYINDGSALLKSRDGGRSLNISIEKNMPLFLLHK